MPRHLSPDTLKPKIKAIIEYYLEHPDTKHTEIAKAFNLTQGRISQILNSPRVTACYPILARRRVQSRLLPKAMQAYERLIEKSDNDAVVEKAAARVLSSENVLDGQKIHIQNEISFKNLQEMQQTVKEAAQLPSAFIDAEIVPNTVQDTTQENQK